MRKITHKKKAKKMTSNKEQEERKVISRIRKDQAEGQLISL